MEQQPIDLFILWLRSKQIDKHDSVKVSLGGSDTTPTDIHSVYMQPIYKNICSPGQTSGRRRQTYKCCLTHAHHNSLLTENPEKTVDSDI